MKSKPAHSLTWIIWLVCALIVTSRTRNPMYLTLIFLCMLLYITLMKKETPIILHNLVLRLTPWVILVSGIFNALMSHAGEHVMFTLPVSIPLIGGIITFEGLLYGLINGLILCCILAIFTIFSRALSARQVVRLIPRAFFPAAIVISIALSFLPATLRQFQQIREAQMVRGHRITRVKDWLPLIMPLLIGSLERAFALAETLASRNQADISGQVRSRTRLGLLAGLVLVATGWLLPLPESIVLLGVVSMLAGGLLVTGLLWREGKRLPYTNYKPDLWNLTDYITILGAIIPLTLSFLPFSHHAVQTLAYSPYPSASIPGFDPLIGISIIGLLTPAYWKLVVKDQ